VKDKKLEMSKTRRSERHLKKLAIVAGDVPSPRMLQMIQPLAEDHEITIFAFDKEQLADRNGTGLKIKLFSESEEMPGYMRNLENDLLDFDTILAFECTNLSSFQALRSARKYGIPFGAIVSEFRPLFYRNYKNIMAIQYDIYQNADFFLATSDLAVNNLVMMGINPEQISKIPPLVNERKFRFSAQLRAKFRSYIKVPEDEVVILFNRELEVWNRPQVVLNGLDLLSGISKDNRKIRVIFAGTGSGAMDLKYSSYDKRLGDSILFLHQDPEPFWVDLLCSCDLGMWMLPENQEFHEPLPISFLESMACGVVPIVSSGGVEAEFAGSGAYVMVSEDAHSFAGIVNQVLGCPESLFKKKSVCMDLVSKNFGSVSESRLVVREAVAHLDSAVKIPSWARIHELVNLAEKDILLKNIPQAQIILQEALLAVEPGCKLHARVLSLLGECGLQRGSLAEAGKHFLESLRLVDDDARTLRGLGFISWHSHANEDALTYFRKALAIDKTDCETMYGIALIYRRIGLIEEALFWLEKCIVETVDLNTLPRSVILAVTQACSDSTNPDATARVLERLHELLVDDPHIMMSLGQTYLKIGKISDGNALIEQANASDTGQKLA
jgi:glycosyltransferase involved in cell wall biosynthesis